MTENIKTVIHCFDFDCTKPGQNDAYIAFAAQRRAEGARLFRAWGGGSYYMPALDGAEVELETAHVFDNQWNTAPVGEAKTGLRVFDWAEDAIFGPSGKEFKHLRRGHYLDQTDQMRQLRQQVSTCGYCGHHYGPDRAPQAVDGFCEDCLGSEFLTPKEIYLLRLLPAGQSFGGKREPLTEAEAATLLPRYQEAQTVGRSARDKAAIARKRRHILERVEDAKAKVKHAEIERDGALWALEHLGIRFADNLIYYSHTGRFCFGWQKALSAEDRSALLDKVSEFPFDYDIGEGLNKKYATAR